MQNYIYDTMGGSDSPQYRARANTYSDIASNYADFVPFFSEGLGASDSYADYQRGNYGKAAIGALATVLGVVPVVGDTAAMGLRSIAVRAADAIAEAKRRGLDVSDLPTKPPLPGFGNVVQTAYAGDVYTPEVIDFINNKGYSESPLMGRVDLLSRPESISPSTWVRRVDEYQNNQIANRRENARILGGRIIMPDDRFMQTGTYEQMLGRPIMALPADRNVNALITRVAGVDIDPYRATGGPGHADEFGDWASEESAARAKQAQVEMIREATKQDPVMMYMATGHAGSNFSAPASVSALRYMDAQGGLTDRGIDILNAKMLSLPDTGDLAGIAREWPRYKSPKQVEDWLTINRGGGNTSFGKRRKAFMSVLESKALQNEGSPIPGDVYSAVNEQYLRGQPHGFSGYRAMIGTQADPRNLPRTPEEIVSYSTVIPSQGAIALDEPMVPWKVMYPGPAAARASKGGPQAYRSFQTSTKGPESYQMADDKWLSGIQSYLRNNRND
jgi:hypothetical protein